MDLLKKSICRVQPVWHSAQAHCQRASYAIHLSGTFSYHTVPGYQPHPPIQKKFYIPTWSLEHEPSLNFTNTTQLPHKLC